MIIAYCANRAIYHLLPTAINSVLKNNADIEKIYIFIEDDKIDYINHPAVIFVNCNDYDFLIRKGINCTKRFPYMAMVRCFFSKMIDEDKVLYLDVDTTVDGSLEELWNTNLGGTYLAAREESNGYFNSGVLLMNLRAIRNSGKDNKLLDLLKTCKFVFPDQDAMNIIFNKNVTLIPEKFNKMGRDYQVYDGSEIIIRHYAGITKPWKKTASELDKQFWGKYYTDSITK